MEFATLPRLNKGISCALRHSGKYRALLIAYRSSAAVRAEVFPVSQRSIFQQRGVGHI
ncbi:unnamed protein product [Hymenolepis diminuta]|uniref:Uncharacterized protein n=1 Tax=Hymenolepis diminuta TaxID=6216 RepID=A0A564YDY7_HYMDI|nr:unnamed protein product [Hymenolepis diminuta]